MTFEEAFDRVIGHEGVLSLDSRDSGNWTGGKVGAGTLKGTKFGISAATYPMEDIMGLTIERARALYKRDFWAPAGCDAVPDAVKFDLFDMAVNSGVRAAIRTLQKAAGADVDGILGPRTLLAVQSMPAARLVARFNGARLAYMTDAAGWQTFSRGWAKRIAANLLAA